MDVEPSDPGDEGSEPDDQVSAPGDERSDGRAGHDTPDAALARIGAALAEAVIAAVPGWVEASVDRLVRAWSGAVPAEVVTAATAAGRAAQCDVEGDLRRLLAADVDAQWTNPMTIVRWAVGPATVVLRDTGVGPVVRSPEDEAHFPEDPYGLTPHTFAELDPSLHDLGILWGALKARAHLARHRPSAPRS